MSSPLWMHTEITGMHLELTNKCNSRCPMCPRYINDGADVNPLLELTEVTLQQFTDWFNVDFIKQQKSVMACGNYGDPIIASDMLEIYDYMRSNNDRVALRVHTNGSARTTSWWKELGKICNKGHKKRGDYVTFSIDGLKDTNHLYRRSTSYEKIMENVEAYLSTGGIAHWDFIVFRHNEHQVDEALELAKKLGFENFNIKRSSRYNDFDEDGAIFIARNEKNETEWIYHEPVNKDLREDAYKIFRENLEIGPTNLTLTDVVNFENIPLKDSLRKYDPEMKKDIIFKHNTIPIKCRVQYVGKGGGCGHGNEIFLTANGYVYPCCFLGGTHDNYLVQINEKKDTISLLIEANGGLDSISLKKHKLKEITESPIYQQFITETFELNHPLRSYQCSTCCGTSNVLDSGELGAKNSGYI